MRALRSSEPALQYIARRRAAALAAKPLNKMQTGFSEAARAAVVPVFHCVRPNVRLQLLPPRKERLKICANCAWPAGGIERRLRMKVPAAQPS